MPLVRATGALRAASSLSSTGPRIASCVSQPTPSRSFSSSDKQAAADHGAHEDHYDPPSGWLFGVKPGEKPEKEGWENIFIYGFYGTLALGAVAYAFKPDTSIQTWALEEARRRLEAEGILKEPESKA